MPIRKLNAIECELVEPQLVKPILNRICRRNCIEWRTNELNGVTISIFNANVFRYSFETSWGRAVKCFINVILMTKNEKFVITQIFNNDSL